MLEVLNWIMEAVTAFVKAPVLTMVSCIVLFSLFGLFYYWAKKREGADQKRLKQALTRARAVNDVEGELAALVALAEMKRRQRDPAAARELLADVWEYAERGPYPLIHADALNILAEIEREAGNREAAITAATRACEKAWCGGPPFAYDLGLKRARARLQLLGAPEPKLPVRRIEISADGRGGA